MTTINLNYYSGQNQYSDGEDIENELLDMVTYNNDFSEILATDERWPIMYHLSPHRRNLLEWYPFETKASVLEIGAGCGALTGLFCERTRSVTAVELSKKRAQIIAKRYDGVNNLRIFAGNLLDMQFDEKFDYITMVGVLEYTKTYIKGVDPYKHLLRKTYELLAVNGKLIIAIENKFGMKYWAGSREDHTGIFFDGIRGYAPESGIETFGKREIEELLAKNGFANPEFYYPHPDYKFPFEIFSDKHLPVAADILEEAEINDGQDKKVLFEAKKAFFNVIKNGQFDFFANSFLIVARKK